MFPNKSITDAERIRFLKKLDGSDLMTSEWEMNFIESFLKAGDEARWFTDGRRCAVDRMRMKYGSERELEMPYPLEASAPAKVVADTDGCEFLVREDGVQRPCNEPAAKINRRSFRYCEAHYEQVQRDLRRRGAAMEVRNYP